MNRWRLPLGLVGLILLSAYLRTKHLGVSFWIDEALSVGIADRPLGDLPGTLRLDGSPPLYYAVLHVWMRVLGDRSEEATHVLSLLTALAVIPVAFFFARTLFTERAAWCTAVLAAVNPFLSHYAQETRMYALVVLLGTIACACFIGAFLQDRGPRWNAGFAVSLTLLLYTHNWALFFGAATGVAWLILKRDRRGVLTFGAVALAYAPWLPTLFFQAQHTGAPWARAPTLEHLLGAPEHLLGEPEMALLLLVALVVVRRREAGVLLAIFAGTILLAWLMSQSSPAWATRYLAIGLPPLLLAGGVLAADARRWGTAAVVLVALFGLGSSGPATKSNVRNVAEAIAPSLSPGDLVVSTQPEQAPALAYYLDDEEGLRWATIFGPLTDLGVTDWRDGVERMQRTSPQRGLAPLLDGLAVGAKVALVEPEIFNIGRWSAPWTALVRIRSNQWRAWMLDDARFRVVTIRPEEFDPPAPNPVRATVFLKVGMR